MTIPLLLPSLGPYVGTGRIGISLASVFLMDILHENQNRKLMLTSKTNSFFPVVLAASRRSSELLTSTRGLKPSVSWGDPTPKTASPMTGPRHLSYSSRLAYVQTDSGFCQRVSCCAIPNHARHVSYRFPCSGPRNYSRRQAEVPGTVQDRST
jgi:hypothetical protein